MSEDKQQLNNHQNDNNNNNYNYNNKNSNSIRKNNLKLYMANENDLVTEHPIEIDDNFYFYFQQYPSVKFKSLICLLEYYISDQ